VEIKKTKTIFKTPPEEHKRQPADANSIPGFHAGTRSIKMRKQIL